MCIGMPVACAVLLHAMHLGFSDGEQRAYVISGHAGTSDDDRDYMYKGSKTLWFLELERAILSSWCRLLLTPS